MFFNRFFWKLYLGYVGLVLLTTVVISALVHYQLKQNLISHLESSVRDKVAYLASHGDKLFQSFPDVQKRALELGKRTQSRITLIRSNGVVLADSHSDPAKMENHGQRPEILAAIDGVADIVRRFSHTLGYQSLYLAEAVRTDQGKLIGVVRVSIPARDEEAVAENLRVVILLGGLMGILVAALMGVYVAHRVTGPVKEMVEVAEGLRAGDYTKRVRNPSQDELGHLGDTFNKLSAELTKKIDRLVHDEGQLRAILTHMVEGVIAVDDSDTILFCNKGAMDLLGRETQIFPGKKIWEFTQLRDLRDLVEKARRLQHPVESEVKLRLGDQKITLQLKATLFNAKKGVGVILVLHDISELRRLERVRQDFVANVSHELKTPLTSIRGYVEILMDEVKDKGLQKFLGSTKSNVEQLTNLVMDLLQLAQIESADEVDLEQGTEWESVFSEILPQYELEIARKKLVLKKEFAGGTRVQANRESLLQVADNLVSNAVRYTPEGGTISLRSFVKEGRAYLEVEDTGIGIPKKELSRVFERFYRVDKARSRALGGTGLGLAIVKHRIQAINGEIEVESELDKGSIFRVILPQ